MQPKKIIRSKNEDLFRSRLENIIDMRHPLVKLAGKIDWSRLEDQFKSYYSEEGRPGLPIRLICGLQLLKHMEGISDEEVCGKWEENPYYQYFCGEEYFQHRFPCESSGLTHFRKRVGEEALKVLLQETLRVAYEVGAIDLKKIDRVAIDTTVQEKAIAHPTDHGLLLKAIEELGESAREAGIKLRQSYIRVAKLAAIKAGRYIHARQLRRAKKALKYMRIRLKRIIRDIRRKAVGELPDYLKEALIKARQISEQKRGDINYLYSWHAPEVECIGKGKARKAYEFGCKVSLATNLYPGKGGHFIIHAFALHGRPYDGHTLEKALLDIKAIVGKAPKEVMVDKGYRGHKVDRSLGTAVYISGSKRGITEKIKRSLKRRAVIEPIIGHAKNDGLLGRNYLKGPEGDKVNAILSATGFNMRQLVRYLRDIFAYFYSCLKLLLTTTQKNTILKQAF
jgi:IS5 family transposase